MQYTWITLPLLSKYWIMHIIHFIMFEFVIHNVTEPCAFINDMQWVISTTYLAYWEINLVDEFILYIFSKCKEKSLKRKLLWELNSGPRVPVKMWTVFWVITLKKIFWSNWLNNCVFRLSPERIICIGQLHP